MIRLFLAAGVAALAISAPASAERGDRDGKRSQAAKSERGGEARAERRASRVERRSAQRVERRSARVERRADRRVERRADRRVERRSARMERRDDRRSVRVARRDRDDDRRQVRVARDRAEDRRQVRVARGDDRREQRVERRRDRDDARVIRLARDDRRELRRDRRELRIDRRENRFERRADLRTARVLRVRDRDWDDNDRRWVRARGLLNGCPPGLAMKDNGCMPPGQARKMVGNLLPAAYRNSLLPERLRYVYRDNDDHYYRYGDGYLYRVNRDNNLVASLLPLLGAGYVVGDRFPNYYQSSYLPDYYRPFYQDYGNDYYRYANGYIYEVDGFSNRIEDVIPAYGYGYGVGQMWPSDYSYYNVPYQYRDTYYDTDDYYYRYAPGAIYQVDAGSNLITAVASLLTGGFAVGQQLPMGYDVYNVPYAYRSQYYDTPDSWYRYNNGNIYQVDPTTRLITAVIAAIV